MKNYFRNLIPVTGDVETPLHTEIVLVLSRICPICKKDVEDEIHFLTLCPAYQEKRKNLFEYLNKEYRIVNRMAPDDVFLLLINPPSKNKPVQKLIAKYVFDCYEKRRSLILY